MSRRSLPYDNVSDRFAEQKESLIREQVRKINELEDACQDFEGTISQFRELVLQLQT